MPQSSERCSTERNSAGKKIWNRRAMIKDYSVSLEHSNNGCMDSLACAKHTYFTRLIYYD